MGNDEIFKKKREGRKRRLEGNRDERKTEWLVVCEGKRTEPDYFNRLAEFLNENGSGNVKIRAEGMGRNTEDLVKHLEDFFVFNDEMYGKIRIPYEKIILVFDKDSFGADQFNSAIKRAERLYPNSIVAWSNESFELWLCLHYDYIDAAFGRNDYNDRLTGIFRKKGVFSKNQNYEDNGKNDSLLFDKIVETGGSLRKAVRNARRLVDGMNIASPAKAVPATMMFKAVEALAREAGYKI